jgi:excisionase family DNA binding protein
VTDVSVPLVVGGQALAANAVVGFDDAIATLSPAEAARQLGVTRSRIYALVRQGELDDSGAGTLRVTLDSVQRRLAANAPVGEPIRPLGAWAILALASSDAAFRAHVAARLSQQEQSRARLRLKDRGLVDVARRLRQRGSLAGRCPTGTGPWNSMCQKPPWSTSSTGMRSIWRARRRSRLC